MSAVLSCVQTAVWLPVFESFNVCTEADACDCTPRGAVLYGHRKRESALEATTSGEKIPCRTRDLNTRQYYAWLSVL